VSLLSLALMPLAAEAQTGGAGAPTGEATTPAGGAGLVFSAPMRSAGATWYGPGLYGRRTACGQVLGPDTVGVAHRSLPCGTTVKFAYHGHSIVTQVIDRGPYSHGNSWDLTLAAARALHFDRAGADQLRFAVPLEYAGEWQDGRPAAP
jgi:rare lipoprotein A (peptidoglycan hydrolase)